ncbi:transposase family protein [Bordetella ansorpii]|uniref:transposase family protein n=1 Tax=Bordetella ansorpii TaxID=288768 RepID=UPI0018D3BE1D|nr:transposase family protein [Bordetella ansorpii]
MDDYWRGLGYTIIGAKRTARGYSLQVRLASPSLDCERCSRGQPWLTTALPMLCIRNLPYKDESVTLWLHHWGQRCTLCRRPLDAPPGIDTRLFISERLAKWLATQAHRDVEEVRIETAARRSSIQQIFLDQAGTHGDLVEGAPAWFDLAGYEATHHAALPRVWIVHVKVVEQAHACPDCGSIRSKIVKTQELTICDEPHDGRQVLLVLSNYETRRCLDCGRQFRIDAPSLAGLHTAPRVTRRAVDWVCAQGASRSQEDIAKDSGITASAVSKILDSTGIYQVVAPDAVPIPGWIPPPDTIVVGGPRTGSKKTSRTRKTAPASGKRQVLIRLQAQPTMSMCPHCESTDIKPTWRRGRTVWDIPTDDATVKLDFCSIVMQCQRCWKNTEQLTAGIDLELAATDRFLLWLADRVKSQSVDELIAQTGASRAVVHRIVRALRDRGQAQELLDLNGTVHLNGYVVSSCRRRKGQHHVSLVSTQKVDRCMHCGSRKVTAHENRTIIVRDVPIDGLPTRLHVTQPIYRCDTCGRASQAPSRAISMEFGATYRLIHWIHARLRHRTREAIADQLDVSPRWLNSLIRGTDK